MRITLNDVAKHAHVSLTTASRAINGEGGVSAETRARVWRSVEALNYPVVRDPGKLGSVAVVGPVDSSGLFFQSLYSGIIQESSRIKVPLCFWFGDDAPKSVDDMRANVQSEGVLGVIYVSPDERPPFTLASPRGDVVCCAVNCEPGKIHTVNIQTQERMRYVVRHLERLGHRRVAFGVNRRQSWGQRVRLESYTNAARKSLLTDVDELIQPVSAQSDVDVLIDRLSSLHPPVTAIIASSTPVSHWVFLALEKKGLAAPERFSFVGFSHDLSNYRPPYDHVVLPTVRLGVEAVSFVQRLTLRLDQPAYGIDLAAEFASQGTTGPV